MIEDRPNLPIDIRQKDHRVRVENFGHDSLGFVNELVPIVRENRYPPLLRVAALRQLIHLAPLDITKGAPYCTRRRYVRQHYRV